MHTHVIISGIGLILLAAPALALAQTTSLQSQPGAGSQWLSTSDLSAAAVTRSASCPPESAWPSNLGYPDLYVYNQCYSSDQNWSKTGIPDYQLADAKDGISVQFSAALAGAIASVKVGGEEYIASPGHGSAFTYAIHPNAPSPAWCPPNVPNCVATECYNPTEEGNIQDDYRDSAGNPSVVTATTPVASGQRHGPSTSDILSFTYPYWSGSVSSTPTPYAWFRSDVRLTNFIPDNTIRSASQCTTYYANTPPYNQGLSHYLLDKEVRLGSIESSDGHLIAGGYPVLSFNATLTVEQGEPPSPNFDTVSGAYLLNEFQTYYSVPSGCASTQCLVDVSAATKSAGAVSSQVDTYIVAKDSNNAVGIFANQPTGSVGQHLLPTYWVAYGDGTNPNDPFVHRGISVTYYSTNVAPGTINYKTYYVFGSLAQVVAVLADLRAHANVLWSGTPTPAASPTAMLTVNRATSATVNVGDTASYVWNSTNAVSAGSTYTTDTPACGATSNGPFLWSVSTLSGSKTSNQIQPCQAGHTYTITYTATNGAGENASASVIEKVNASTTPIASSGTITASPNPCLIAANASTCATGLSWSAPDTPGACLFYSADASGRPGRWCVASTTSPYWPNWITTNGITFTLRSYDDPNAPALSTVTVKGSASCPTITHNLYLGSTDTTTGGQVTELQQFLGGQITGYFGYQTRDLVKQWQAAHGIVSSGTARTTGWGAVGPKTRAAIAASCGSNPQPQPSPISFSASPTSGSAPLAVTFGGSVNSFSRYTIDFGDGQTQTNVSCPSLAPWGQFPCSLSPVSHTYAQAGTYVAKLIQANYCGPSYSGTCTPAPTTLGSATITVGGSATTPTATFTANGSSEITANVGDTISYLWSSTYAASATSTYTVDSTACNVAGGVATAWVATTLSGSKIFGQIQPCQAGHTYTITYTATNSAGASASATVIVHVNQTGTQVPQTVNQILSTGQSLSLGAYGDPALTTTQPYHNVELSGTALVPLVETSTPGVPYGETISSAMANFITANIPGKGYEVAVTRNGLAGVDYNGLKKGGTYTYGGYTYNSYALGIQEIQNVHTAASALGQSHDMIAITAIHGETDAVEQTPAAVYESDLVQWQSDYQGDSEAITGQTGTIPLFIDQMSSQAGLGLSSSPIPLAQLAAAQDNAGKIVLVTPMYFFPYYQDGVHLINTGYRWLGEYFGKVIKQVVVDGKPWVPLSPRSITRQGNVITVQFNVPVPPLQFDTTIVSPRTNYGFEYHDDSSSATISNVQITAPDTVQITLSAVPTGANQTLAYAFTRATSGSPSPIAIGGNLRDSDATRSQYGNTLYNWAVTFSQPITTNAPALSGTMTASPNPCTIAAGATTCTTELTWSTANDPTACLFYSADQNGNPGRWCVANQTVGYWPSWITTSGITFTLRTFDSSSAPALSSVTVTAVATSTKTGTVTSLMPSSISGTSRNVAQVNYAIVNASGAVAARGLVNPSNGAWSATISPALPDGTYVVTVISGDGTVLVRSQSFTLTSTVASGNTAQMASVLEALRKAIAQLRLLLP